MEVAELNNLRRRVKALWQKPGERPQALIHLSDEEGDRAGVGSAFQTLCSEIGVRHVRLDFAEGLTDAHRETLVRTSKHPRMVVMTRFEGMQDGMRATFHDLLCADSARTLPVVVGFAPKEEVERVHAAWSELGRMEDERVKRVERLRLAGYDEEGEPLSGTTGTATATAASPAADDGIPFE